MVKMQNDSSAVPAAFVFLPDKQMSTYGSMMKELRKVVSFEPGVQDRILVAFEWAFWNSISPGLPWAK
jgi:hypothetical protein